MAEPEPEQGLWEQHYGDLREVARRFLDRGGQTLQATALVHEAFFRLKERTGSDYSGQTHFVAAVALAMKRVLLDEARKRGRAKRGGDRFRVTFLDAVDPSGLEEVDLLELQNELEQLGRLDEKAAKIVELKLFGGMTDVEIGGVLDCSDRTVRNHWQMARAWLGSRLHEAHQGRDDPPSSEE